MIFLPHCNNKKRCGTAMFLCCLLTCVIIFRPYLVLRIVEKFEVFVVLDEIFVQFRYNFQHNQLNNKRRSHAWHFLMRTLQRFASKHFWMTPKQSKNFNIIFCVKLVYFLSRFGVRMLANVPQRQIDRFHNPVGFQRNICRFWLENGSKITARIENVEISVEYWPFQWIFIFLFAIRKFW